MVSQNNFCLILYAIEKPLMIVLIRILNDSLQQQTFVVHSFLILYYDSVYLKVKESPLSFSFVYHNLSQMITNINYLLSFRIKHLYHIKLFINLEYSVGNNGATETRSFIRTNTALWQTENTCINKIVHLNQSDAYGCFI